MVIDTTKIMYAMGLTAGYIGGLVALWYTTVHITLWVYKIMGDYWI